MYKFYIQVFLKCVSFFSLFRSTLYSQNSEIVLERKIWKTARAGLNMPSLVVKKKKKEKNNT